MNASQNPQLPITEAECEMLKLDNQVCFQIYAASRAMTNLYRPALQALGLTYPQYLVMLVLWEQQAKPPAQTTVNSLGKRLYLDSGTLTPLLKRLEQQGLIQRIRDRNDERQVILSLTQAGIDLSQQAAAIPLRMFCQVGVPLEELLELKQKLEHLLKNLHGSPP